MATTDRNPAYSLETPFVGFGRIAAERVRSLHDRLWLQAAFQCIACYVGCWGYSGRKSAESGHCQAVCCGAENLRNIGEIESQKI